MADARPMTVELARAITQLYGHFSRYRADHLSGCPHCVVDADSRHLAMTPIRSLSAADLEHYARKAMTTWGSVEEFKHFLPRLFEILARDGPDDFVDAEILLGKPGYGQWRTWTQADRTALENFLHALWLDILSRHPHSLPADSFLCGVAGSEPDLRFYLDAWAARSDRFAMRHLADFIDYNSWKTNRNTRPELANAFWDDRAAQAEQVWTWLLDPARATQLERAFFAVDDDSEATLSRAIDELAALRRTVEALD